MIIYKKTFENVKYSNCNFTVEDKFECNSSSAIIADGVTTNYYDVDDIEEPDSVRDVKKHYPRVSGGKLAALDAVNTYEKLSGISSKEKLIECNKRLKELNDEQVEKCDYLTHDLYGTVASCFQVENDVLDYAYICDCGVAVYDKNGNIKIKTEDDKRIYADPYIQKEGKDSRIPEDRAYIRKKYRNNPANIVDGVCAAYGVLNGEKNAECFIRSGKTKLHKGDRVILFSDGMYNYLEDKEFIDKIIHFKEEELDEFIERRGKHNKEKYGAERTLIIYKHE